MHFLVNLTNNRLNLQFVDVRVFYVEDLTAEIGMIRTTESLLAKKNEKKLERICFIGALSEIITRNYHLIHITTYSHQKRTFYKKIIF